MVAKENYTNLENQKSLRKHLRNDHMDTYAQVNLAPDEV